MPTQFNTKDSGRRSREPDSHDNTYTTKWQIYFCTMHRKQLREQTPNDTALFMKH